MSQPVMRVAEVTAAIAALTVPGITLYGLDEMPPAVNERMCPLFGPSSNDPSFLTDWDAQLITLQGNKRNNYNLHFKLYQAPVGADRGLFKQYPVMVENARKLAEAIQAVTRVAGCKHVRLYEMPQFGPVTDASGQQFHGAAFTIQVVEF